MKTHLLDAYAELWKKLGAWAPSRDNLLDGMIALTYEADDDLVVDGVSDWILIHARIKGSVNETDLVKHWLYHVFGKYEPAEGRAFIEKGRIPVALQQLVKHGWLYEDKDWECYRPTIRELPKTSLREP